MSARQSFAAESFQFTFTTPLVTKSRHQDPPAVELQPATAIELPFDILERIYQYALTYYWKEAWQGISAVSEQGKALTQSIIFQRIELDSDILFQCFHHALSLNKALVKYPKTLLLGLDFSREVPEFVLAVIRALSGDRVETVYLETASCPWRRSWNDIPLPAREALQHLICASSLVVGVQLNCIYDFPGTYLRNIKHLVLIESSICQETPTPATPSTISPQTLAMCGWKMSSPITSYNLNRLTHLMLSWECPVDDGGTLQGPRYAHVGALVVEAPALQLITVEYFVTSSITKIVPYIREFLAYIKPAERNLSLEWRIRHTGGSRSCNWEEIEPIISAMEALNGLDVLSFQIGPDRDIGDQVLARATTLLARGISAIRVDFREAWRPSVSQYAFVSGRPGVKRSRHVHEHVCPVLEYKGWDRLKLESFGWILTME